MKSINFFNHLIFYFDLFISNFVKIQDNFLMKICYMVNKYFYKS